MKKDGQLLEKRAAIYTRVSSVEQEEEGTSLDTQEAACRRFAAERGCLVEDGYVYREVFSGTVLRGRPRLSVLREAVRPRGIPAVICYALDRLSRNQAHIYILAEEFQNAETTLKFVTERFEDSADGRLIRSAKAVAAEGEHEKIKERTIRGRVARAHSGKIIPGWKPMYGYRWMGDGKTHYAADDATAAIVRRMYAWASGGVGINAIAGRLTAEGIPTPTGRNAIWRTSTVARILTDRFYTGHATTFRQHNWRGKNRSRTRYSPIQEQVVLPEGTVPALVDTATFEAVQQRMASNKRTAARTNANPTDTLLRAGFARCGYCGYGMIVNRNPNWGTRYTCGRLASADRCRELPSIVAHKLDTAAWEYVAQRLLHPEVIAEELSHAAAHSDSTAAKASIERAIEELERKQRALVSNLALLDADSAALVREQLAGLSAQRRSLESELAELLQQEVEQDVRQERILELAEACRFVSANLERFTYEQKRLALQAFDIQVTVYKETHEPRYDIVPGPLLRAWIVSRMSKA